MTASVRMQFEKHLGQLNEDVLQLGSQARQAVARAVEVLIAGDVEAARQVIVDDEAINRRRFEIERECYALLVTEQPMAGDMRVIVAALIVVTDLERIADHGKKIAKICLRMMQDLRPIPFGDIPRLSQMALAMMDRALRAYATRDLVEADAVCKADDQVDALYKQTFNVVLSRMLEDPRMIGPGTQLIQVAHELERVADRATNIGERVIYSVTGELAELNV
ncbi:MAG: phosphate transport system regulatory protein PhoU [Anaerolineae bacterium CG2_30_64_16]|nr:MAG: phosphate transport system regulatory protein PhoU [Anaerolineae bacterium CG2_30_64_16]